jgi:hypothetical protein
MMKDEIPGMGLIHLSINSAWNIGIFVAFAALYNGWIALGAILAYHLLQKLAIWVTVEVELKEDRASK